MRKIAVIIRSTKWDDVEWKNMYFTDRRQLFHMCEDLTNWRVIDLFFRIGSRSSVLECV